MPLRAWTRGGDTRARGPCQPKRTYLLRGPVYGECGARMRADTRVSRGSSWKYYLRPVWERRTALLDDTGHLVVCRASRVPAHDVEEHVFTSLAEMVATAEVMNAAREELRHRLKAASHGGRVPREVPTAYAARRSSLSRIRGDISRKPDYRRQRAETEDHLAQLPSQYDKSIEFDRRCAVVRNLDESLAVAMDEQRQELVSLLVERVDTADKRVTGVRIMPPARPFFQTRDACARCGAPPGRTRTADAHLRTVPLYPLSYGGRT